MKITRLPNNPIITPDMDASMGSNINGPSLIHAPSWLKNPLGKYYLYFAHHQGQYIRLATSDQLSGPWKMYEPGTLQLQQTSYMHHIASPDVHVDEDAKQIVMFFHGCKDASPSQKAAALWSDMPFGMNQTTRRAVSDDGINFHVEPTVYGPSYLRAFRYRGRTYGLLMPGFFIRFDAASGHIERGPRLFTQDMRHSAVRVIGDTLEVVFSNAFDCPERLLVSHIDLTGDWQQWEASEPMTLLSPELPWEGGDLALEASQRGAVHEPARQLRDPCFYKEDGQWYLLYSVAGEHGIGIARID